MTTTKASCFCPNCGHNLEAEQLVELGALKFDPRGAATWRGQKIPLTSSQFLIFGALVLAGGRLVSKDVLADRAGYDGQGDAHNVVDVLTHRIRRALRLVGIPPTIIRAERGRGFSLDLELLADFEKDSSR